MAKITKRIASIFLVLIMLIASSISVFAADDNSFTVKCSKVGYTFDVFQIATLNEYTGEYEKVDGIADAIWNAIKGSNNGSSAAILAACDNAALSELGTSKGSWVTDGTDKTFTGLSKGIYYVKCTGTPVADATVLQNSIVVLPGTESFSVDSKVKDGSTPNVYITFEDGTSEAKSFGSDETIAYTLKADITGTASYQLKSFIIKDKMDAGLSAADVSITSVKAVKENGESKDLTYDYITNDENVTFAVSIKGTELESVDFYDYDQVVVKYTTKLAADAVTGTAINNTDSLSYKLGSQSEKTIEGQTVAVKTYEVSVKTVNSADKEQTLANATFEIYSDENCQNKIASAISGTDGIAKFDCKFAEGWYYVKQVTVPNGFNMNNSVFTLVVDGTSATTTITVQNAPTILPSTGGAGTMMFTISGISLIVVAGALFVVFMKKRKTVR